MPLRPGSAWEGFYREFRRLECKVSGEAESREARRIVRLMIEHGSRKETDVLIAAKAAGFEEKLAGCWYEIQALAKQFPGIADGRSPERPLEDAYCAAYSMVNSPTWQPSRDQQQLYRGQRNHRWTVTPSLFRDSIDEAALQAKKDRVRDFARALQKQLPQLNDAQAVAVAQHYSAEAKLQTWLIDVTWDPLVALFFASDQGQEGELGVVSYYTHAEWDEFSAGGKNAMGAIQVIEVPGISRIAAQRALFIDTSHPEFFAGLIPFSIWFRQRPGLVFEDETLEWPVSRRIAYPPNDSTADMVVRLAIAPVERQLDLAPRGNPAKPLTAEDYFAQMESWLAGEGLELRPENYGVLQMVCRFYFELSTWKSNIDSSLYSLHRRREAFDIVAHAERGGRAIGLKDAVRLTLSREKARSIAQSLDSIVFELEVDNTMALEKKRQATLDRLVSFITDVDGLNMTNGFGFGESPDPQRDLEAIKKSPFWTFIDLRGTQAPEQLQALIDHWNDRVLVIAVEGAPTRPLYALVKGMIDKRDRFDLGDGVVRSRRKDQTLVIAFPNARSMKDVPERYYEMACWSFN